MALTAGALYICIATHQSPTLGTVKEGDILLGSKIPAASEALFIALGSTRAEVEAQRATAGHRTR